MESKKRKVKSVYTKETLKKALQEIRDKNTPVRRVSKKYNVPRTTLLTRMSKQCFDVMRRGPDPLLGIDDEKSMADWLIHITKCGFQIKKTEIENTAQQMMNESMTQKKFKNGRPGRKWFLAFLNRNPEIANLQKVINRNAKTRATEESLRLWFYDLEAFLEHRNSKHILDQPENIFCLDETTFVCDLDSEEILGPKTLRTLYKAKTGNEEDLTVLTAFNANGDLSPPCITFPYNLPPRKVLKKMPHDWCLGNSDSDLTKSFVFFEYITNYFSNWIESKKLKKPVLLLINAQKSHLTLSLCAICEELEIILYAIPGNASHILRPSDGSVFHPLKNKWNTTVKEFLERSESFDISIKKEDFWQLLQDAWQDGKLASKIGKEFAKCGLFPFDPEALDYSRCFEKPLH